MMKTTVFTTDAPAEPEREYPRLEGWWPRETDPAAEPEAHHFVVLKTSPNEGVLLWVRERDETYAQSDIGHHSKVWTTNRWGEGPWPGGFAVLDKNRWLVLQN